MCKGDGYVREKGVAKEMTGSQQGVYDARRLSFFSLRKENVGRGSADLSAGSNWWGQWHTLWHVAAHTKDFSSFYSAISDALWDDEVPYWVKCVYK